MTLIVGIRCTDGAVIAADSAVTFTAGSQHTISDSHRKIRIIEDKLILAGTGQVGLGQRFAWQLKDLWSTGKLKGGDPVVMARTICQAAHVDFASTGVKQGSYGALLAFPASRTAEVCEFAPTDLQPELKTEGMWYASMGSGQTLADPYLRLMRTVFWQDGPPDLQSAKFAAMWVLSHSITAAPGFIAEPISMAVLERKGDKDLVARMLPDGELDEHKQFVESATGHFREFEQKLLGAGDNAPSIPKPPKKPAD